LQKEPLGIALKHLFHNKNYIVVLIFYTLVFGSFLTQGPIDSFIFQSFNFTTTEVSFLGAFPIIFGAVGAIFIVPIYKKYPRYKVFISICIAASFFFKALANFSLFSGKFYIVGLFSGGMGFFLIPLIPIILEVCAEVSFPVGKNIILKYYKKIHL
jgi:nitrate/nitrite transporter NarK